jgi:NAD(P)H-dependent flavin oxidoreductase YrpB (nitropropane dioxygenase family)
VKTLNPIMISGREMLPLLEAGKGVAVSDGESSGAWARAGGIGTVSGVNPDYLDDDGAMVMPSYKGKTRIERHEELVAQGIRGGITQIRIAHENSGGEGRLHLNVLWEMGGSERVLNGVLEGAKGLIHGITCGAGMPYRVAEIATRHDVFYYPIVSSARAFRALWKRAYHKNAEKLGGVVYEDPWLAGGHNGLSNAEDPMKPQAPFPRVIELRKLMREFGLDQTPIVMAGGVWYLRDWEDWIDNPDLGPIVFQFGTRPLLTRESPISDAWKKRLPLLKKGDMALQHFSPTGFWSSALHNDFILELEGRTARQVDYRRKPENGFDAEFTFGPRGRAVYVAPEDKIRAEGYVAQGYESPLRTPDESLVFVTPDKAAEILNDQTDCMGCLSQCRFSNWAENEHHTNGRKADPRSFCIQKTLLDIAHGGDVDNNLVFGGHNAFLFASDPFYSNGFIPTAKQLFERIITGD